MKKKIIAIILSIVTVLGVMSTSVFVNAEETTEPVSSTLYDDLAALGYEPMFQNPAEDDSWYDDTSVTIGVTTYANYDSIKAKIESGEYAEGAPLIAYVINHNGERVGTESDVSIVSDYLGQDYVVVVIDFYNNEKFSTDDRSLGYSTVRTFNRARGVNKDGDDTTQEFVSDLKIDKYTAFILPSGYRVARDKIFFDFSKHASQETLDYILDVWNNNANGAVEKAVEKAGQTYATVGKLSDIVMADGSHLTDDEDDMQLKMDIIYPSNPENEVPAIAFFSTATPRNTWLYSAYRPHNQDFLFRGYAVAWCDYEYLPFLNTTVGGYGHIEPYYALSAYEATRVRTAAIRCIKYYADELGYSDTKIGATGHSKASWSNIVSNPSADAFPEKDSNAEPLGAQPFTEDENGNPINAEITCVYHSMGVGSRTYYNYLTSQNVPTLIACGEEDSGDGCTYWEEEKTAYINSGIDFIAIDATDDNHNYPYYADAVYSYYHYTAYRKFFDYYLKDEAPVLLYTSVGKESTTYPDIAGKLVEIKTKSVIYNANDPSTEWEVVESDKLFVQFSAPVTEKSFLKAVSLKDSNGREVKGSWYAEGNGNKWIFEIDKKYVIDETYTLTIADGVATDRNGRTVEKGIEVSFAK